MAGRMSAYPEAAGKEISPRVPIGSRNLLPKSSDFKFLIFGKSEGICEKGS